MLEKTAIMVITLVAVFLMKVSVISNHIISKIY